MGCRSVPASRRRRARRLGRIGWRYRDDGVKVYRSLTAVLHGVVGGVTTARAPETMAPGRNPLGSVGVVAAGLDEDHQIDLGHVGVGPRRGASRGSGPRCVPDEQVGTAMRILVFDQCCRELEVVCQRRRKPVSDDPAKVVPPGIDAASERFMCSTSGIAGMRLRNEIWCGSHRNVTRRRTVSQHRRRANGLGMLHLYCSAGSRGVVGLLECRGAV